MSAAAYVPAKFTDISSTLAGMFSELGNTGAEGGKKNLLRSVHCNAVFVLSSPHQALAADDTIQKLAIIHPSRFFVLVANEEALTPRAEVCAQCHLIPGGAGGKSEHLCSEVIRIHFRKEDLRKVPAILRANFVTSAPVELFFSDAAVTSEIAAALLPLADQIYFDSAKFEADPSFLLKVSDAGIPVVDTQWLGTSAWRDQVRAVFEGTSLPALARGISKVEIFYAAESGTQKPFLPFLLAGWFVDRLGLEILGSAAGSFDCEAAQGGRVRLSLSKHELDDEQASSGEKAPFISSLAISGIVRGGKDAQIRIEKKSNADGSLRLDTTVRVEKSFRLSRGIDQETESGLLSRFFMIGESIANYRAALGKGLLLKSFQKNP